MILMVTKWSSPDEFVAILSDLLGFQPNKTPSDKAMQASFTSQEEFCNWQNVNCTMELVQKHLNTDKLYLSRKLV